MTPFYTTIESLIGPDFTYIKLNQGEIGAMRRQFEYAMVLYAWRRSRGNQCYASKMMGINRNTFRKLKAIHGITFEDLSASMRVDLQLNQIINRTRT